MPLAIGAWPTQPQPALVNPSPEDNRVLVSGVAMALVGVGPRCRCRGAPPPALNSPIVPAVGGLGWRSSPVFVWEFGFYVTYVGSGAGWAEPASAAVILGQGPCQGFGGRCVCAGAVAAGAQCWVGIVVDHGAEA
jgi:hypothetical protein